MVYSGITQKKNRISGTFSSQGGSDDGSHHITMLLLSCLLPSSPLLSCPIMSSPPTSAFFNQDCKKNVSLSCTRLTLVFIHSKCCFTLSWDINSCSLAVYNLFVEVRENPENRIVDLSTFQMFCFWLADAWNCPSLLL